MISIIPYFNKGVSYDEYLSLVEEEIKAEKPLSDYSVLNLKRMERVAKTFQLSEAQVQALETLHNNFKVVIITEGWCGDASQTLPVFKKFFEAMKVEVKYIFRDDNMEMMQHYFTHGSNSIPIVIGFNEEGKELFRYGPRPQKGMDLLKKHKDNPEAFPKEEFYKQLQQFYNKDKGVSTLNELTQIIQEL